jgi:Tfp pilus assembly protein PilV
MRTNQEGFSILFVIITLVLVVSVAGIGTSVWRQNQTSKSQSQPKPQTQSNKTLPRLIDITECSDYCPDGPQAYKVYEGINNETECEQINGQVIKNPAWGVYIGCGPK